MIPLNDPDIRRHTTPFVCHALILANVAIAVYQLTLNSAQEAAFIYRWGAIPWELTTGDHLEAVRLGPRTIVDVSLPYPNWVTIFSSMFLHGGLLHLGGNMLFLWVFGDNIEDRFGHLKFLLFYLISGVAAVWAQVYVDPSSQVPMVGASGAIAGVLGAYLVLFPLSRVHTLVIVGFLIHVRLPAVLLIGAWAALQAFSGLASLGIGDGVEVAYFAHLGGFVVGFVAGLLYWLLWVAASRGSRGRYSQRRMFD